VSWSRFCYFASAVVVAISREQGGEESTNSSFGVVAENAKRVDDRGEEILFFSLY